MIYLSSQRILPCRPHKSGQYRVGFVVLHPSASYPQKSAQHPAYHRQLHIAGAAASCGCAMPLEQAFLSASNSLTYQSQGLQSHWPIEILQNPVGTYQSLFPIRPEWILALFHILLHLAGSLCQLRHSDHLFEKISARSGPRGTPESRPKLGLYFRFQIPPRCLARQTASSQSCLLRESQQIQRHSLDFQKNSDIQHFYSFSLQNQGQKMSFRTVGSP